MGIKARIDEIQGRIAMAAKRAGRPAQAITLLAVTKTLSVETIQEAYDAGLRRFGENRVQEALEKQVRLPGDIQWHLIGQLQTNKINKVLDRFELIHSIDSLKLAKGLSERLSAPREILLEVNSSGEATKAGFAPSQLKSLFAEINQLSHLKIRGLMTVGPLKGGGDVKRGAFKLLKELFETLKPQVSRPEDFSILSMGMSGDFEIAIEEGSTLVRLGTALFGERV
jgi:pyridoxal phosphate enzyme (YggS family)